MSRPERPCEGSERRDDVSPFPPKLVGEMSKNEYITTLKEARWNADFGSAMVLSFLGVSTVDQVSYSAFKTSIAHSLVLRFCIPDFLKSKGLEIVRTVAAEGEGEYPPAYSNIEYEEGKFESRLTYGSYFVKGDLGAFVIKLEEGYSDDFEFRVASVNPSAYDSHKLMEDLKTYGKEHNFLIGKKLDPSCSFLKFDHPYTWDDLIIPDNVKDDIRKNLSNLIDHRELYRKNKLQVKRGLIFSGEPGCGKSTVGKILCNTTKWTFLWVTPKYLDQSKRVAQILNMCRDLSPTILFLEDIDLYGGTRESNGNPSLLGELMNQLDGIQENTDIITIATTNKPEILEKALIDRPGRFDKVIAFPKPGERERLDMLKLFTKTLNTNNVNLDEIAHTTKEMTGAKVRELVNLAVIHAVDDKSFTEDQIIILKPKHFTDALQSVEKKDFNPVGFSVGAHSRLAFDD